MRAISPLLLITALLCACVGVALDFGWIDAHPAHPLGWIGAGIALFLLAEVVDLVDR